MEFRERSSSWITVSEYPVVNRPGEAAPTLDKDGFATSFLRDNGFQVDAQDLRLSVELNVEPARDWSKISMAAGGVVASVGVMLVALPAVSVAAPAAVFFSAFGFTGSLTSLAVHLTASPSEAVSYDNVSYLQNPKALFAFGVSLGLSVDEQRAEQVGKTVNALDDILSVKGMGTGPSNTFQAIDRVLHVDKALQGIKTLDEMYSPALIQRPGDGVLLIRP